MRDVFLNGTQIKAGSEISLPVIIKMCQYNNNQGLLEELINRKNSDDRNKYTGFGNFGNLKFDFSIDCAHRPLKIDKENGREVDINYESENMQWINSICYHSKFPTFRRDDLEKRFWILQIPDYGHQSMSAFYRDFVPHVYFDGKKVWQKYVGMIRQYSQRAAYILIDKKANITIPTITIETNIIKDGKSETIDVVDVSKAVIRICFKNNIEQDYRSSNSIFLNKLDTAENNFVSYIAEPDDQNFLFSNQNRLNDNYEVYINDDTPLATSSYFFDFQDNELLTEDSNENKSAVSMQTKEDYFRQSFINDYITLEQLNNNDNRVYDRPAAKRNLVVKVRFSDVSKAPKTIKLKSAENSYNAIYGNNIISIRHNTLRDFNCFDRNGSKIILNIKENTTLEDYFYYSKTRDSEINEDKIYFVFSKDKYVKVNNPNEKNLNNYYEFINELEIVPEHTNTRKYEWTLNSALSEDVTISEILYSQYIYPWNVKNNTVLGYNNGSLILFVKNNIILRYNDEEKKFIPFENENTIGSGTDIKDLIIYDDGEVDSTIESTNKTITGLVDLPSITATNLNTSYEVITDPYLLNDERKFGNESGVFTYDKDDLSLRVFIYDKDDRSSRIETDEPWHSITKEGGEIKDIQFNNGGLSNSERITSIKNYLDSLGTKEVYINDAITNITNNYIILERQLHTILESAIINNNPIAINKHTINLSEYNSGDFLFINFTNKKENGVDAIYGSNEWFALTTEEKGEPYYFQYRDLSNPNKNYVLLFITKNSNTCYLHSSVYIKSINKF